MDFSRQTCLPEVGERGQRALKDSKVLVVGAGGTGSPAIMYLASAGVGRVDVCDPDVVDVTNLHRQILHTDIGERKAVSAKQWVRDRGSWCEWSLQKLEDVNDFRTASEVPARDYDLILDCTDRWSSHRDVIMSSVKVGKTVIHGSIAGLLGRVMAFGPGTACWLCLHPEKPKGAADLVRGTLGPVCGMVGSTMAMEALRILLGMPSGLLGKMMTFDAHTMVVSKFEMSKLNGCSGCG